jgi:hypothetical protein
MAASLGDGGMESSRVESSAVESCSKLGDSQRGREAMNTEVERSTTLEAVSRQRQVKTQQMEKT